jgi:hypothetical protein
MKITSVGRIQARTPGPNLGLVVEEAVIARYRIASVEFCPMLLGQQTAASVL